MSNSIFEELPAISLEIAEAYALVYPERPARSNIQKWLNQARAARSERGIKPNEVKQAIDELVEARLLLPSVASTRGVTSRGPSAVAGTITQLCESAFERGSSQYVIDGLAGEYRWSYSPPYPGQRLRHALISGRLNEIEPVTLDPASWFWLTEPDARKYLEMLPDPLRQTACETGFFLLTTGLHPIAEFLQTCQDCAPEFQFLSPDIALAHILRGDFARARATFEELPDSLRESKQQQVAALATDALVATLRNDDAVAIEKINAALTAERSGTRKRNVYPELPAFALSLLALVRDTTPESAALLKTLRSMHKKVRTADNFETLFIHAEAVQQPHGVRVPVAITGFNFFTVLLAIISRWHPDFNVPSTRQNYAVLQHLFEHTAENGYSWAAAEILTVLEAAGMTSSLKPALLEIDAATRHRELGTTTLTNIVKSIEPWEYALKTLESLTPTAPAKNKKSAAKAATKPVRLVWSVTPHSYGGFSITPLEQRMDKAGNWSAGRAVSLKRLHDKAIEMNHLIEQDKKAAAAVEKSSNYGWDRRTTVYDVGDRAIFQLVGHPAVIGPTGATIDVVERPAELQIDTDNDRLLLKFQPETDGNSNYLSVLSRDQKRLEVTHFTAAQLRINDAIPHGGLKMPATARQRLLDLVASLANDIAVQSDSHDRNTAQHDGDPTPLLQLDFSGDALSARFRVEPVADTDVLFDAGEGGNVVYVPGQTGTVQVLRDLAQERALMQSVINHSTVLSQAFDGRAVVLIRSTEQALELLDELQQLQIRCLWPSDIPYRITARADSAQMHLTIKSASRWFSASGELKYNEDDAVSLARLMELLEAKPQSRFIELANGEFLALSKTLKSQLDALQTYSAAQRKGNSEQRLHPLASMALDPLLESAQVTADKRWHDWRKQLSEASTASRNIPSTLEAELRPYQIEGFQWLARMGALGTGACLADDMGLGKTIQTLAVLLLRAPDGPALVVAPTSVTGNWLQEAQRFAPTLKVHRYAGNPDERQQLLKQLGHFDLLITSYGLLHNDIDTISAVHWHSAVLDEAQAIKNASTGRAKAARQLSADFRMAATGTPIQNNLMDLHSLFSFLNPGLLGSESRFKSTFALPIERDGNQATREQLRALVAPFLLRRNKRDVLQDLPAKTEITLTVELSPEESTLYEALRRTAVNELENHAGDGAAGAQKLRLLAQLMRLRRLCCNPQLIEPDWHGPMAKLSLFASTLEELLANRHKVLVFSQFVDHLKILENHLKNEKISYQYLDGSTPAAARSERVAAFQAGEGEVFLISLTAGGTGLNLTAADYVIHMDPWWNPAVEDQASDRAHRIGQQRPVTIYRMVTAGTIEAQIQELHTNKRDLADSLLAGTDSATIDSDELMRLLREPMAG